MYSSQSTISPTTEKKKLYTISAKYINKKNQQKTTKVTKTYRIKSIDVSIQRIKWILSIILRAFVLTYVTTVLYYILLIFMIFGCLFNYFGKFCYGFMICILPTVYLRTKISGKKTFVLGIEKQTKRKSFLCTKAPNPKHWSTNVLFLISLDNTTLCWYHIYCLFITIYRIITFQS